MVKKKEETPLQLVRRSLFQFNEPDGEACGEVNVEVRLGCHWITSLWVKHTARGKGLGKRLMQAAVDEFGHESLYLHVMAFEGRPLPDEQLLAFYGRFGFVATEVPGVLIRKP